MWRRLTAITPVTVPIYWYSVIGERGALGTAKWGFTPVANTRSDGRNRKKSEDVSMRVKSRAIVYVIGFALLFATTSMSAQSTTATLQGTVIDQTGAVVPNAEIKITNTATNLIRTTKTDSTGSYLVPALPIGTYNIEVTASGLGKQIVTGLVLDVGRTVSQNLTLKPAAVQETISITGEAPVVESTTMTVGQVV